MIDVKGRWALVTGASRGVGRQIAMALAEKGCNLVLHSRELSGTKKLAGELKQTGILVRQLAAELSDTGAAVQMAEAAESYSGGIDILYNNAAVLPPWRDVFQTPGEDYISCFAVNAIAVVQICDTILPEMIKRGFGRVVNLTSGIKERPAMLAYSLSKAAVIKYVRDLVPSLAGTGVIMNLLDPGWLRTDLGGSEAPAAVETVLPGALVPAMLDENEKSGIIYRAHDY